jgi:anti-sigma factor RsiW
MNRVIAWLRRRVPGPHPGITDIVTWCDGDSDAAEARRVAAHMFGCAQCRRHAELVYEARARHLCSAHEAIEDGLRDLHAQMRAWRHLQGHAHRHAGPSPTRSAINRRIAAAVTVYFGARAAVHLERSADSDERHLFPASQALFSAFLGKRAADALSRRIAGPVAP